MNYRYKVLPFIGAVEEYDSLKVAEQLWQKINAQAEIGYEFYQLNTVNIEVVPGCIAGLLGSKSFTKQHDMLIFRKERTGDEENKGLSENEVSLEELNEVTAAGVHAGDERLRVQSINDTCDSFKSRLKVGDVIVSFGSMQIYSIKSLRLAIKSAGNTPNDADFTVLRDGKIGLLELKKLSDDIAANLVTMETITI